MPDENSSSLFASLVAPVAGVIGLAVTLAAVIKSLASDGTKHAANTNAGLFTLVNTLQGTVNTLIEQQAATQLAQTQQAEKLGRLSGSVEHLQRDNDQLHARLTKAEADLSKEVVGHALTRAALSEANTSLAQMTEKRDEMQLTLDEKCRAETCGETAAKTPPVS